MEAPSLLARNSITTAKIYGYILDLFDTAKRSLRYALNKYSDSLWQVSSLRTNHRRAGNQVHPSRVEFSHRLCRIVRGAVTK